MSYVPPLKILSRKDALALGLKHYFTGKPCPAGHVSERSVAQWTCVECGRIRHFIKSGRPVIDRKIKKLTIDHLTCSEAKALGLSRYFTGLACIRGHVAERYVSTKKCVECNANEARSLSKETMRMRERNWRKANVEKVRLMKRNRRKANVSAAREKDRENYYKTNGAARTLKYFRANRDKINSRRRARYAIRKV